MGTQTEINSHLSSIRELLESFIGFHSFLVISPLLKLLLV